jgi:hypothetical protein
MAAMPAVPAVIAGTPMGAATAAAPAIAGLHNSSKKLRSCAWPKKHDPFAAQMSIAQDQQGYTGLARHLSDV